MKNSIVSQAMTGAKILKKNNNQKLLIQELEKDKAIEYKKRTIRKL